MKHLRAEETPLPGTGLRHDLLRRELVCSAQGPSVPEAAVSPVPEPDRPVA
jgi:hypothetical protein